MSGSNKNKVVAGSSIGLGMVLAIVISWTTNKAILWAIIHGLLSWFYVIYYLLTHTGWTWL